MTAFISKKQSLVILLAGIYTAIGIVLLLTFFLKGPRMGPHYDILNKRRSEPLVFQDILLIRTDEIVEGGDVFTALMTLSEFDAWGLVIEVPVLSSSPPRIQNDREIVQRLNDEYALLGRNIRSLFEAIRLGSVRPVESQNYVEGLVELAERGRDRLSSVLIRQEGISSVQLNRAAGIFGNVFEAADLRSPPPEDSAHYSRPRPDNDGRIRRITPDRHIVYEALKPRWEKAEIEYKEQGPVLTAGDFQFPLDINGNILIESIHDGDSIRGVDLEYLRRYIDEDHVMRRLLKEAEALGFFSELKPERIPPILYDYALGLWDDLMKSKTEDRSAWIRARKDYFSSLDELFNSMTEANLVDAYEELIATEKLKPDGIAKLQKLRDDLISSFAAMREKYLELEEYRNILAEALDSSFCIMGPAHSPTVEASASLANTLLTGRCVTPGQERHILFWSILAVLILLAAVHSLRPVVLLITGTIASLLCFFGFGWSFIILGYWIDPLIPALPCMSGTLVMFYAGFLLRRNSIRRFRLAYGPAVNKNCLKALIRTGQPRPSETQIAGAAIVAVKNAGLLIREDKGDPLVSSRMIAEFRASVSDLFKKAGAVVIGCEGEQVLVCFGSPLERIYLKQTKTETVYGDDPGARGLYHPVVKAAGFVSELIQNCPASWHFGLDFGKCAFSWSDRTGYTANGRPLIRARVLCSLTSRYQARVLVTDTVREKLNQPVRKLHVLKEADGREGENFYELLPEE
jgi:hypothetical protein